MQKLLLTIILISIGFAAKAQTAEEYFNKGYLKAELNDFKGAIVEYTKSIKIDPNDAETYYNRGVSKRNLKDFKGAILDYTKAIELDPNKIDAYNNRAFHKEH